MCGIAGIFNYTLKDEATRASIEKMIAAMHHRGPDEYGVFLDRHFAMGMSRLSIIDLGGGSQPISNEDETLWVTFNGEIFNYLELQQELKEKGHRFKTHSDTECIIHLYEEYGDAFVKKLNGQFAIAIWDSKSQSLVLARDRVGIRPLYFSNKNGRLIYGSEIKAIFASDMLEARFSSDGLRQIYSYWVNLPGHTCYDDVEEIPAGHLARISSRGMECKPFWQPAFPDQAHFDKSCFDQQKEQLRDLMIDATRLRLRADVPVAAYLSGGLDSSIICALVKKYHSNELLTFSVAFKDSVYDESSFQKIMARHLGTRHTTVEVDNKDIAEAFIDAVWYAEKPMIRSAPAPLLALSRLVRENNIKVVLTGEGADEMFGGYNIFKEDKIRRFWARQPESNWRPLLLARLYPYILGENSRINGFWQAFFKKNLLETDVPYYSHMLRWSNMQHLALFLTEEHKTDFSAQWQQDLAPCLPAGFNSWHPLNKAQFLEITLFMTGYLLSSQGDRMMMGNSIEGRFPFLDHRVIEWAAKLNPASKIKGLNEKFILKEAFKDIVPPVIARRPKQPYRAPITKVFLADDTPDLIKFVLDEKNIKQFGIFNTKTVKRLFAKLKNSKAGTAARDEMALTAIVSQQLLHYQMIENRTSYPGKLPPKVKIVDLNKQKTLSN